MPDGGATMIRTAFCVAMSIAMAIGYAVTNEAPFAISAAFCFVCSLVCAAVES